MVLMSFTHIGYYILRHWIGTSHEISILAADVLKLMCISPFLLAAREYYWGIMLKQRLTRFIWQGKLVNLVCLLAVLAAAMAFNPANAAIVGVLSFIGGEAAEFIFLLWVSRCHLQAKPAQQMPRSPTTVV
jgi:progressive ankylosis protein